MIVMISFERETDRQTDRETERETGGEGAVEKNIDITNENGCTERDGYRNRDRKRQRVLFFYF